MLQVEGRLHIYIPRYSRKYLLQDKANWFAHDFMLN